MTTLFENHRQAIVVRIVLWFMLLVGVTSIFIAWAIAQWYGLAPGDGGALRPLSERLIFAGIVLALGALSAGGMILYATIYVLKIHRYGDTVTIETLTPLGLGKRTQKFAAKDFDDSSYQDGSVAIPGTLHRFNFSPTVYAPWLSLQLSRQRLPLILDMKAETIDYEGLHYLSGGTKEEWLEFDDDDDIEPDN